MLMQFLAQVQDPQYPKVEGWEIIPRPGDLEYPVPTSMGRWSKRSQI